MPDPPEPRPPDIPGLGPHVVGTRIVVRRVLRGQTGPSGGPAMTDLLGVCTSWADGVCVVQPETGAPVAIDHADIVSGKPVPPRPSVRHRVGAREAQVRALALFPDLETRPLGAWLVRRSPTAAARRANSVLAFGPSGVEGAYAEVVAFYERYAARPIAAVLPGSGEDELFRAHGWLPQSHDADTHFLLAGLARARRALRAPGHDPVHDAAHEVVLDESPGVALVTARAVVAGETVARGVAAYDRDWVGLRSIETAPAHRRTGLGRAVMAALLEWGAERGATTAYLQVLGENEAALRLYDGLGFAHHHAYRYLAAPG